MARRRIGYNPQNRIISSKEISPREWESECVADLSYDPEREEMTIVFQKRGTYAYFDVPIWVYAEFNNAGSRGTYFNSYIRGNYSYERVS